MKLVTEHTVRQCLFLQVYYARMVMCYRAVTLHGYEKHDLCTNSQGFDSRIGYLHKTNLV